MYVFVTKRTCLYNEPFLERTDKSLFQLSWGYTGPKNKEIKTAKLLRFRFPAGAGSFSLHRRAQNGSGAHPASYPMGTRGSFPRSKAAGRETDHSPPSSAEVKEWLELCLHSTNKFSWRGTQFKKKARGTLLYFTFGVDPPNSDSIRIYSVVSEMKRGRTDGRTDGYDRSKYVNFMHLMYRTHANT
jgi:hypothetical protein